MKILSIDTASNICGVSILEDKNLILNLDINTGRTHSENLMPIIAKAFSESNISIKDIDLLVCDKGPGSFTGIRIGVATIKAFNDSLNIPCIGINSLEALTYNKSNLSENSYICSIIDAKNNNCYFALYQKKNGIFEELLEPQSETIDSTLAILESYITDNSENYTLTFIGDGTQKYSEAILATFPNSNLATEQENELNSYSLGIAGLVHYEQNIDINDVLPLYLKKPQAQKLLEEKMMKNEN